MSHCHDEHEHGGHDHDHGDHVPPPDTNQSQSLHQHIDHDRIRVMNTEDPDSGKKIFKSWDKRLNVTDMLESDVDEQLLIFVPFTGLVKLHSILIRTANDDQAPRTIKLFKNREDIEFSMAEDLRATVQFEHPEGVGGEEGLELEPQQSIDDEGIVEYAVNRAHFSSLQNLTIFIQDNYGADTSKIFYIGMRGEWTRVSRAPVVTLYEAAPNPADHKTFMKNLDQVSENP